MNKRAKLINTTPETLETLRQADAFAQRAQDESLTVDERNTYAQMATVRYNKIYIQVETPEPAMTYGAEGKNK